MIVKNLSIKAKAANFILSFMPLSIFDEIVENTLLIGFYHIVSDEEVSHIKNLYKYKNILQFKKDMDFISKKYKLLSMNDFLCHLKKDQPLPKKAFLLTFDDGLRENYDIITPILFAKGIPATFFVCSEFIDNKKMAHDHKASLIIDRLKKDNVLYINKTKDVFKHYGYKYLNDKKSILKQVLNIQYQNEFILNAISNSIFFDYDKYLKEKKPYLTTNQIKNMIKKGFSIGAHSIDHPLYSNLLLEQQIFQTLSSISVIKDKFNLDYGVFAFPHNSYGVSNDFYHYIKKTGLIDVFFGTEGISDNNNANKYLYQRICMETPLTAQQIINLQFARYIYNNMNK